MFIDGGRIYVQTYSEKAGDSRWLVFNLDGSGEMTLYLPALTGIPVTQSLHTIDGGTYYFLREDDQGENWELMVSER